MFSKSIVKQYCSGTCYMISTVRYHSIVTELLCGPKKLKQKTLVFCVPNIHCMQSTLVKLLLILISKLQNMILYKKDI